MLFGPMSTPSQPSGNVAVHNLRLADLRVGKVQLVGDQIVHRQQQLHALRLRLVNRRLREIHLVRLGQALAHFFPQRQPEGVGHRPADDHRVRLVEQRVNHLDLVAHFRAAQNHAKRPVRVRRLFAEKRQLLLHQQPRHAHRQMRRDARRRGVRPVRRPKGVVHIRLRQLGQSPAQTRCRSSPPPRKSAHFPAAAPRRFSSRPPPPPPPRPMQSSANATFAAQLLFQRRRHRLERMLRVALALGPPEVARQDHLRPLLRSELDASAATPQSACRPTRCPSRRTAR